VNHDRGAAGVDDGVAGIAADRENTLPRDENVAATCNSRFLGTPSPSAGGAVLVEVAEVQLGEIGEIDVVSGR